MGHRNQAQLCANLREGLSFRLRRPQAKATESHPEPGATARTCTRARTSFIYMLEGTLEVWLDEVECHVLEQGDSFWFESNRGHRWFNPTNKQTVILWVNTPPTF